MKNKNKSAMIFAAILLVTAGLIAINALGVPSLSERGGKMWGVFNIRQGLDLMGGVSILYEADISNPSQADMNAAQSLLRGRLDRRGYTEADAAQEGLRQIRVDIPGVEDAQAAINEIGATARLTFLDTPAVNALAESHGLFIDDYDRVTFTTTDEEGNFTEYFNVNILDQAAFLRGEDVAEAFRTIDDSGPGVSVRFNSAGERIFAEVTERSLNQQIYIFMDDRLISSPFIRAIIRDGTGVISGGGMTMDEAQRLAVSIKQGSLPFALDAISYNYIGARLGADALRTSIIAGAIGLLLVLAFMAVFYKTMGICADLALIIYVAIVLFLISALKITLSLPGIAGLILSIGMATDANIVIFERIREEVSLGKTLRSAMRTGYKRALPAIVDSNVTTLIAGGVLFWLGTGPIMSFANMLIIGILVSMFTCLIITRI
ncbi:MAG: protein translocase subunit SecD, partial [Defluviitaleaceae bacterium]|nr:protein translocase subunit SecD [Defluviitaleaceae bacterium]